MNPSRLAPKTHRVLVLLLTFAVVALGVPATALAVPGPDVTITKTASASTIDLDGFVVYTLTARNIGTALATNVRMLDGTIDANDMTVTDVTTTKGTCTNNASINDVDCKLGDMAPDTEVTMTIRATPDAATCDGRVRSHAAIKATNEPAGNFGNNEATPTLVMITGCGGTDPVDLTITKAASDNNITAGEDVTYTITVENVGTATANNVVVFDFTIDLNDLKLINVEPAASCGGSNPQTNDVVCRFPTIAAGAQRVITILTSSQPLTCDGFARNHAEVRATNEPFANQGDDSSNAVIVNIAGCGDIPNDTTPPSGTVRINNGGPTAYGPWAKLNFTATDSQSAIANVLVSNSSSATGGVLDKAKVFSFGGPAPVWSLTSATYGGTGAGGSKNVFVQYQDGAGNWSPIVLDQIKMVRDAPNTCAGAKAAAVRGQGVWQQEQIFRGGDVDWFKFHKGSTGHALVTLGAMPANYNLTIHNASCQQIASAKDAPGFEQIYRNLTPGTYFARVAGASNAANSVTRYSLRFESLPGGVFVLNAARWTAGGQMNIAGVVLNNTFDRRRMVRITVRFHNASNGVIGSDSALAMLPNVGSHQQAPFRITGPAMGGVHHVTYVVTSIKTSAVPVTHLQVSLDAPAINGGVRHQRGDLKNNNSFTVHNAKTAIAIFDNLGRVINTRQVAVSPATLANGATGHFDLALTRFMGVVRQTVWAMATH